MNAVPYGEVDLLRIWVVLIGKVSGGASPSPTQQHSVYLMIGVLLFIIQFSVFNFQFVMRTKYNGKVSGGAFLGGDASPTVTS